MKYFTFHQWFGVVLYIDIFVKTFVCVKGLMTYKVSEMKVQTN